MEVSSKPNAAAILTLLKKPPVPIKPETWVDSAGLNDLEQRISLDPAAIRNPYRLHTVPTTLSRFQPSPLKHTQAHK
jgi:hypothetical protein